MRRRHWALATALGALAASIAVVAARAALGEPATEPARLAFAAALGAAGGPILASAQAAALRRRVERSGWWLLASAAAWAAALPFVHFALVRGGPGAPPLLAAGGAIAGAVQGLVLLGLLDRRRAG
jgi:hypothetical protein